jgi:TP901 family phage tail tape measure protein
LADRTVSVDVTANVNGFVSAFRTAQRATEDFASRTEQFVKNHGQAMKDVGDKATIMGGAILAGVGLAVKAWGDFSDRMAQVQSLSHASASDMDQLQKAALSLGTAFGQSANDVADAEIELVKAGVSVKDMLGGALPGALALAAAGQIDVGEATSIATTALTQFKLEGKDVPHVADLLSAGADKALGGVKELGDALKQGGLVASSFGISVDETVGTLSAFANAGLMGSDAGTSLKTMLLALANPSKQAANTMAELGIHAYDAQGKFVGLAGLADELKAAMGPLTDAQRNQALATIFGTDAIRSANVLFKEGGDGIRKWTADVNDQGFAAEQAAGKMNSLNGDLKKLSSSFENALITTGQQADGFLRPLVQSLTGAVQWFNGLDNGVKGAGLAAASATGGVLLLAGGFLSLAPRVFDTISGFKELSKNAPAVSGALGKIGKAAAGITLAATALAVLGHTVTQKHVTTMQDYADAILKVGRAGAAAKSSDFNGIFNQWDDILGHQSSNLSGLSDSIHRITHPEAADGLNRWADQVFAWTGFAQSETTQVDDRLKGLGDTMGQLVSNGAPQAAAASFKLLSDEFVKNGSSAQDALDHLPGYKAALQDLAHQSGVTLEPQELLQFALGEMPSKLASAQNSTETMAKAQELQKQMTEDQQKRLAELGVSLDGVITNLGNFVTAMSQAGLLQLSTNDAMRNYEASLDAVDESIKKNGKSLDIHTEAGRNNQAALDGVAKAGLAVLDSMAKQTDANGNNVHSQQELQDHLKGTYNDLLANYAQFGITGDQADTMARQVLGIPKNVSIDTWMSDYARQKAEETRGALDAINGRVVRVGVEVVVNNSAALDPATYANAQKKAQSGDAVYYASGGRVSGPGGPTDDKAGLYALSNGEYVLPTRVAQAIGYDRLDKMRGGDLTPMMPVDRVVPTPVQAITAAASGGGATPIDASTHFNAPVYVVDPDELSRKQETARRDALAMIGVH